jgi:acyl-CoA hydrolase/GNAT superfamily N-acetyltransferase
MAQPDPQGDGPQPAGLWDRLLQTVRGRFGGEAEAVDAQTLPPALRAHAAKVCSAEQALASVRHGDHVFVGGGAATPRHLVQALEHLPALPADVELLHLLTEGALLHDGQGRPDTRLRHRCFHVGPDQRAAVRAGLADYVPVSLAQMPALIAGGRIKVDVALVQVSPPDEFGHCSLGVSVGAAVAAIEHARCVIAEVNPRLPRSVGDGTVHIADIDHLVPVDAPLVEFAAPAPADQADEAMHRIARYVASLVDDGSTLQIGFGPVGNLVLQQLADRQDLGVHSDVITDALLPLLERGALTGRRKTRERGRIVASFALGSRRLYDLVDRNPLFEFQTLDRICDPAALAAQQRLVAIAQAFAVDLTGQVCLDHFDGGPCGGLAAQPEFLQGAARSAGGKAIVCLASTSADGQTSMLRAALAPPEAAGIARADVHYVVTEYGIACLFGKSLRERAAALIQIAHPDVRDALLQQAKALGHLPAEQQLRNRQASVPQDEAPCTLADGRRVLLRPAQASDDAGVRELFHQLPECDVYARFFRKVKGLSDLDVQRLCNLDFEREVAFVACAGEREDARLVAHACYFADPATGLAETAFMVHPDWQGCGLGAALQSRLAAHARRHGVRGFVAEIMAGNGRMIRLARAGQGRVSVHEEGGTVRVTTLF